MLYLQLMDNNNQQTPTTNEAGIDPTRIGVRIVDVHSALQGAFDSFATSGEDQLEDLAKRIHNSLMEVPAFLIGEAYKI
jgi:predicted trehalose synthase